ATSDDPARETQLDGEANVLRLPRLSHMTSLVLLPRGEVAFDTGALDDSPHAVGKKLLCVEARAKAILTFECDHREEAAEFFAEAKTDDAEGDPSDEIRGVSSRRCRVLAHPIAGPTCITRNDERD